MNKILAVIRREFIERVRTKSFLIGTLLVPLMMGTFAYLPQMLARRETGARAIFVLDGSNGAGGERVTAALAAARIGTGAESRPRFVVRRIDAAGRMDALRDSIVALIGLRQGPLDAPDGVLVLTEEAIRSGKLAYLGSNVTSFRDMNALERTLEPVLREERLYRQGVDRSVVEAASIRLDLKATKVTQGHLTGQSAEDSFWLAYIINLLMYMTLLLYGIQVMTAVIEEKSNRIVEVLVSSLTPFQLLLGKVIGVGAVGLVQLGIWGGAGFYVTSVLGSRSGTADLAADGAVQSFSMPQVSMELVAVVLVFFVLGFFLYSALYAAIGAMCNSQQEAQQANTPVTMIIALGMISMFALINEPSGALARVLSFIPLFAPIVVPVRFAIAPLPALEVVLSVISMMAGILLVIWLAARIYRVGILSYGKKPGLSELWRWIRTA
jgi:ABC-2 type transport system permease protein